MKIQMRASAWLSLAALAFVLSIAGLLAYETWALAAGAPPITYAVRAESHSHLGAVAVGCFTLGLFFGHFWTASGIREGSA